MTTDTTALVAEAKKAMEGISPPGWFAQGAAVGDNQGELLANFSSIHAEITAQPFEERKANARLTAWCGNGGVLKLIEALEERDG